MQAPEVRVCSIFAPISISISISVKGSSKSSPIRHLELVNVRCPLGASPVPPFVPPCRYVLALQARTTDTAAVRCGAQPGAGCPCATRRRSTKPSPSVARVLHLERPGGGRCAVGNQPPTPQTIGDPRGRDPSSPHTICICHAHFVSCAAAMRNALWLDARPSLSGIYCLVIRSPRTSLPSGVPALSRRHHAVVPGVRFLIDGRSRMTATPNPRAHRPVAIIQNADIKTAPCGPAEVPSRLHSADEARIASRLYPLFRPLQ